MNKQTYNFDFDSIARYIVIAVIVLAGVLSLAVVAMAGSLGSAFSYQSESVRLANDTLSIAKTNLAIDRMLFLEPFLRLAIIALGTIAIAAIAGRTVTLMIEWKKRAAHVTIQARNGLYPLTDAPVINHNEVGAQVARNLPRPATQKQLQPAGSDVVDADVTVITPELPTQYNLFDYWKPEVATINNLMLGVGADDSGQVQPITGAMGEFCHSAIGGSSGWGKSVFLRSIALQAAVAVEKPRMVLIDLEGDTFRDFANCDRLLYPIADTEEKAHAVLSALVAWMDETDPSTVIDYTVCLIDESTALLSNKDIQHLIRQLALRARKYRLLLWLGGQDWKSSSLNTAIRNQLSSRIQFYANDKTQSRVLLGKPGAEAITTKGRALARLPGRPGLIELQAPIVTREQIAQAILTGDPTQPLPAMPSIVVDDNDPIDYDLFNALGEDYEKVTYLYDLGLSQRRIEELVFDSVGGASYRKVKAILEEYTA